MVRTRPLASHAATSAADRASTRHKRLDKQALLNNTTQSLLKAPKVSVGASVSLCLFFPLLTFF